MPPHKPKPNYDDADQHKLRVTVADEVERVFKKHNIGGIVVLVSPSSAAWRFVLPKWAMLAPHADGFILQVRGSTEAGRQATESTIHLVSSIRSICADWGSFFGRVHKQIKEQMGDSLIDPPFSGTDSRPDKLGGKN
jgi:hypothetical protein